MNKTYQNIFGVSLALVTFSFINDVSAQTCATPPTCESLGYEFSAADCADRPALKCPFDTSKIYCLTQKEASEAGICMNIGDVLYSDKTCSSYDNLVKGKTPIAIVVDPDLRLAMALTSTKLKWADTDLGEYFDIPDLENLGAAAINSYDGKRNTQIIVDYCKAMGKSCPAAEYAYSYVTSGTKPGDWFLPAGGQAHLIFKNKDIMQKTFYTFRMSISYNIWASHEGILNGIDNRIGAVWVISTAGVGAIPKDNTQTVIPMITY